MKWMTASHQTIRRICLSSGTLGSGGIGRNMLNLAKIFLEKGIEVDLVFTGDAHSGREKEIPPDANVFQLGKRSRYALPATVRYLKNRKPDLLISAHNNINTLNLIAHRLSGLRKKCHVVCTFRTYRSIQLQYMSFQGRAYDWLGFKLYKLAGSLVAVSRGVAEDIENTTGIPKGSVHVIYNPAWSKEMEKKIREECSEPWLKNKLEPVVISVGRLTTEKDFYTLLKGFANLVEKKAARLIILGEGAERKKLEERIVTLGLTERVKLPGHVNNPLAYLVRADLFVLSSAWEGFGNVLVEALGCGLSIVSTDCPSGPREILSNGEFGLLVPVGNHVKLAEAMERALSAPFCPKRQKIAAQRFTFERSADRYLSLVSD